MAKQSKWTNAHLKFDKALSINAKYEPALWAKAEAYRLAYKKDDAIAAYRQYLDAFPTAYKAKQALEKLQGGAPVVTPPPTRPDPVPTTRPGRFPSRTQDVNLTISGTQITANGVAVSGTPQLADWVGIYGKADRVWDKGGVNKVHTWGQARPDHLRAARWSRDLGDLPVQADEHGVRPVDDVRWGDRGRWQHVRSDDQPRRSQGASRRDHAVLGRERRVSEG